MKIHTCINAMCVTELGCDLPATKHETDFGYANKSVDLVLHALKVNTL